MPKYRAEAVAGFKAVEEAIVLLDDGKKDQAVEKLEEASGELEVAWRRIRNSNWSRQVPRYLPTI